MSNPSDPIHAFLYLAAKVNEHLAAIEASALSRDKGEMSSWLARCADTERELREAAGIEQPERLVAVDSPSLVKIAVGLELEVARLHKQNKILLGFMESLEVSDSCVGACGACESNLINRDLVKKEISQIS